ncbi:tail assembly chaperone [Gordonia phage Upyo]|nr:tail assembly chaperone [Gordonia phage Upyo]
MTTEPRRYAEDVDLDSQFEDAPEPLRPRDTDRGYEIPRDDDQRGYDTYPADVPDAPAQPPRRPEPPRRRPEPQDHKVKADVFDDDPVPVWNEAVGIMEIKVRHNGLELTIPADPEDWPIMATRAFETGRIVTAIENLLSAKDFQKLVSKNYRNKEFGVLYEKLAKAGGFESPGN